MSDIPPVCTPKLSFAPAIGVNTVVCLNSDRKRRFISIMFSQERLVGRP